MKKILLNIATIGATLGIALSTLPVSALTAGADVNVGAGVGTSAGGAKASAKLEAKMQTREATAKQHADQEIDRRVNILNRLNAQVQAMVRLTAEEKANIATDVQNQISALMTLKAKIDGDTDMNVLKADIKSITQSYRIFLLVIPQGHITVAADKIKFTADLMATFSAKLADRIAKAKAAGKATASLESSLSDMNSKIADAKVQADAAIALVAHLTPDNGDKAKAEANHKALVDARAKVKAGLEDLKAARKDASIIVQGLISFHLDVSASIQ